MSRQGLSSSITLVLHLKINGHHLYIYKETSHVIILTHTERGKDLMTVFTC